MIKDAVGGPAFDTISPSPQEPASGFASLYSPAGQLAPVADLHPTISQIKNNNTFGSRDHSESQPPLQAHGPHQRSVVNFSMKNSESVTFGVNLNRAIQAEGYDMRDAFGNNIPAMPNR